MKFLENYRKKIISINKLKKKIGHLPRKKKVVVCHGVFDIVHPGHIRHLAHAKSKADILVVSVTADRFVKKGHYRPHVPEGLRAINLAVLDFVDFVIIDFNLKPLKMLSLLKPEFYAKGFEYSQVNKFPATKEELKLLKNIGSKMIFTPGDIVYSSSALKMNRLLKSLMTSGERAARLLRVHRRQCSEMIVYQTTDLVHQLLPRSLYKIALEQTPVSSMEREML
jgi:cytidyltransferase-like protein